jgi:hypothetical protein
MKSSFSLVRYCHNPLRGEFVNFGLLLHTDESPTILSRFSTERIQRIRRLYPDVDESLIKIVVKGIDLTLKPFKEQEISVQSSPLLGSPLAIDKTKIRLLDPGYLEYLSRYHNGLIQFSAPQPVATDDIHKEFDRIYNMFVADPDELISRKEKELPNTIYQRLRSQLKPVERRLDIDYELKRDSIQGLIKGTTVDFIGYNGQLVCGKSIDLEGQGIEASAQYLTILIQVFDVLKMNFEKNGKRGKYYIVTKAPDFKQKKLYHFWMNVLYWKEKGYFSISDVDGAYEIANYVEEQGVIPFSEWLRSKKN